MEFRAVTRTQTYRVREPAMPKIRSLVKTTYQLLVAVGVLFCFDILVPTLFLLVHFRSLLCYISCTSCLSCVYCVSCTCMYLTVFSGEADGTRRIVASRLRFNLQPLGSQRDYVNSYYYVKLVTDKVMNALI